MNELEKLEKAKQDIQDKIDKLKSQPELNKWYKEYDELFFAHILKENRVYFYGIDNGKWIDEDWFDVSGEADGAVTISIVANETNGGNRVYSAAFMRNKDWFIL